ERATDPALVVRVAAVAARARRVAARARGARAGVGRGAGVARRGGARRVVAGAAHELHVVIPGEVLPRVGVVVPGHLVVTEDVLPVERETVGVAEPAAELRRGAEHRVVPCVLAREPALVLDAE